MCVLQPQRNWKDKHTQSVIDITKVYHCMLTVCTREGEGRGGEGGGGGGMRGGEGEWLIRV